MSTFVLRTAEGRRVVRDGRTVREALAAGEPGPPVTDLVALSPVTTPCRVVAQTVNYRSHARDSGFTGEVPPAFFRRASGSVSGPGGAIARPSHADFLDHEAELGLVMGALPPVGTVVAERDVRLTKTRFYASTRASRTPRSHRPARTRSYWSRRTSPISSICG